MNKFIIFFPMVGLLSGCVGITDLYQPPVDSKKAHIRIAIEGQGVLYSIPRQDHVSTQISDGIHCEKKFTPPGSEIRPISYANKSIFSTSTEEEIMSKQRKMHLDEKPVLDFMKHTGIDKNADSSSMRYVFDIEANKPQVFYFEYKKQPGRSWTEPGEICKLSGAFQFEPNEEAEVRFRVLKYEEKRPATCHLTAYRLIKQSNETLVLPKPSVQTASCS